MPQGPSGAPRVLAEDDGAVRILTLNQPQRRNALDLADRLELVAALRSATEDGRCRAIVLTGAAGTFSSGADIRSMSADPDVIAPRMAAVAELIRMITRGPKPVIAAVEGVAFGLGLSLAVACDHVVVARDARLCCAFGRIGLVADTGLFWTLPNRVGMARARQLMLFGDVVDAGQAAGWGLADEVCEPGAALKTATERAARLAEGAPLAIAATKEILAAWPLELDEALARETATQTRLFASEDFAEGRHAFFSKRRPRFSGR